MTAYINYSQQQKDEDDDMSLADIMSLKISTTSLEEKNTMVDNTMWNDWTVQQNELYLQQLQSSYYQLQYLQQQQMMMMMNSSNSRRSSIISSSNTSTTSSINSSRYHHRPHLPQYHQLSPSSSSSSIKQYRSESKRTAASSNSNSSSPTTSRTNRTSIPAVATAAIVPTTEPPKRRQSLGKRIKKVFGMTETSTRSSLLPVELPNHQLRVDSTVSTKIINPAHKKKVRSSVTVNSPVVMTMPDSPNSSISSLHHHHRNRRYHDNNHIHQLPSPASSTVSTTSTSITTTSTNTNNTSNTQKKTLSFNSVIKLHETFSASEYDRRCDTSATCQKLTPVLALKIKEELNNFKLNDMFVHVDSRQNTHFFM